MASKSFDSIVFNVKGLGVLGHIIRTKYLIGPVGGINLAYAIHCKDALALSDYVFMVFFYIDDKLSHVL